MSSVDLPPDGELPAGGTAPVVPPVSSAGREHGSLARNVLSNWLTMAFAIVATFVATPVLVGALQRERYGIWSFLNGLLVYSDLLYLGLGAAVIKRVAACRARGDQAGLNRVSSVVVSIYVGLGLICFVTLATLSVFLPYLFARPLSADVITSARYACILLGGQLLFSFAGSGFMGNLLGFDRFDVVNAIRMASIVGRTTAILTLVRRGDPLVTLACIAAATAAFEVACASLLAWRVNPRLRVRMVRPQLHELRLLYSFGLQSFALLFATTLIGYTDTTVIGLTLGAASVAVYALPLQLVEYVRVVADGISGVLLPRLTIMVERGDGAAVQAAYARSARSVMFLTAFVAAHMIAMGPSFLTLWVGAEFGNQSQWVIVCLSGAMLFHVFAVVVPAGFYQAMGLLRLPALVLLAEAVANLALSVFLAPRMGIVGVAIGTLIPAAVVSCFVLPPYLWRRLRLSLVSGWSGLVPAVVVFVGTLCLQWLLQTAVGDSSYVRLAARVVLTLPPSGLIFVLLFPQDDRRWFYAHARSVRL